MEDLTLSRDFVKAFNDAEKKGQVEEMSRTFKELCAELGIKDPQSDESQRAVAKLAAELRNQRDQGTGGKKI